MKIQSHFNAISTVLKNIPNIALVQYKNLRELKAVAPCTVNIDFTRHTITRLNKYKQKEELEFTLEILTDWKKPGIKLNEHTIHMSIHNAIEQTLKHYNVSGESPFLIGTDGLCKSTISFSQTFIKNWAGKSTNTTTLRQFSTNITYN